MNRLLPVLLVFSAILSFQNCSNSWRVQKGELLSSSSVFGAQYEYDPNNPPSSPVTPGTPGNPVTTNPPMTPSNPPTTPNPPMTPVTTPIPPTPPTPPPVQIPLRPNRPIPFRCTFALNTMFGGTPLKQLSTAVVSVGQGQMPRTGFSAYCSFNDNALPAEIIAQHALPGRLLYDLEAKCANAPDGTHYLNIAAPNGVSNFLSFAPTVVKSGTKFSWGADPGYGVAFGSIVADTNPPDPSTPCDLVASPLLVVFSNKDHEPLRLTSPERGIRYDILGENSDPVPHAPKQISWYRNSDYYFIALPNEKGEVLGIDQLFGNNTAGPNSEQKFAADGYKALAKYDDNRDGWITADDKVFKDLRLWNDSNADGIAQKSELIPLAEKSVNGIDLEADPNFKEVDRYGNETRLKSVVRTENGKLHLMFDLWFKHLD